MLQNSIRHLYTPVYSCVLLCTVVYCCILLCTLVYFSVSTQQYTTEHNNTQEYTGVHRSTQQHATHKIIMYLTFLVRGGNRLSMSSILVF